LDLKTALILKRIERKLDALLSHLGIGDVEPATPAVEDTSLNDHDIAKKVYPQTMKKMLHDYGVGVTRIALDRIKERLAMGKIPVYTQAFFSKALLQECDNVEVEGRARNEGAQKGKALVMLLKTGGRFVVGGRLIRWNGQHYEVDGASTKWAEDPDAYVVSIGRKSGWQIEAKDEKAVEALKRFRMFIGTEDMNNAHG
jgi:hypothetical protein